MSVTGRQLDGGHTSIFSGGENVNESPSLHQKENYTIWCGFLFQHPIDDT